PSIHPLLGAEISRSPTETCFEAMLEPSASWVIEEHVVAGRAVLLGMAYVEIARAAMAALRPGPIELANLSIVAPLAFEPGPPCRVRTTLTATSDGFDFAVHSLPASQATDGGWTAHAHAQLRF